MTAQSLIVTAILKLAIPVQTIKTTVAICVDTHWALAESADVNSSSYLTQPGEVASAIPPVYTKRNIINRKV
jgi:hypothetical protein